MDSNHKTKRTHVLKESGKKKVCINNDEYGFEFSTMRNGHQWSGFTVDDELLRLMQDAINEYLNPPDYWLIVFEDASIGPEVYTEGETARARFKELTASWNCHLFRRVENG